MEHEKEAQKHNWVSRPFVSFLGVEILTARRGIRTVRMWPVFGGSRVSRILLEHEALFPKLRGTISTLPSHPEIVFNPELKLGADSVSMLKT